MRGLVWVGFLVMALTAFPATAQTIHGGQIWGSIQVTAPLDDHWFLTADIQPRFTTDNAATAPITIIPPVVSYRIDETLIVSGGYIYLTIAPPRDSGAASFREQRFFQQVAYRIGAIGKVGIRGQTRAEQRFRSTGSEMNWRVVPQVLIARPLTAESGGITAVASVEAYFNLDASDWGARPGFDQLWSFAGFQVPVTENTALELGYLNQRLRRVEGRTAINHAAVIGVSIRLFPPVKAPPVYPTVGPGVGTVES